MKQIDETVTRKYVNDLQDSETVEEVFLLADKQLRANRNADLYLLAQLRDKTGQISGLMWNVNEDAMAEIEAGGYVSVTGKVQLFQGNLQVIITRISPVPAANVDVAEFMQTTTANTEELMEELRTSLNQIADEPLRKLMLQFLDDDELVEKLVLAPAGIKAHHAYHGGLLEHLVNLLNVAAAIETFYPQVDFDLVRAGIFLHDLGKIRELDYDANLSYSDEGQLIGHLVIGVEMLGEKIRQYEATSEHPFPEETAVRLKHMIVSHHGTYEFGSPKLPMTVEAVALHYLDNLDAKVNEFDQLIKSDPNSQSSWTPFHNRIDRKLYKGCQEGDAAG